MKKPKPELKDEIRDLIIALKEVTDVLTKIWKKID